MLLCELRGQPWERLTTFFQNLDWFFLPTSILKIIDILFKMADFGDIDDDDDEDEGNTSTPFQPDYDSTQIKQETIKFHK